MKRRIIDKRNKQKFQIDDAYINGYARVCGINATGVYMVMCRHVNKQQECFPSKKLIAQKLAISERSVYTAIKFLKDQQIIKVVKQGRKKGGTFENLTYVLRDKSEWKGLSPQANRAVGKSCRRQQVQSPSATGAVHRRQLVPNKDTHRRRIHILRKHIYEFYRKKINKLSQLTSLASQKIASRLKEYSEEDLLRAIDNFSHDSWWMKHNKHRGVAWFFHSQERIEQFINMKPRLTSKRY